MKALVKTIALLVFSILIVTGAVAQQTTKQAKAAEKAAAIKSKIDSKAYVFQAEYAQPLRGGQRYITPDYDLHITPDSAIEFLPYFGRVYMGTPLTPEESGVMFTSTKFGYTSTPQKKGSWSILITPENVKYVSKMQLDVFSNGTATLLVTSNFRDQITYTGYIKE